MPPIITKQEQTETTEEALDYLHNIVSISFSRLLLIPVIGDIQAEQPEDIRVTTRTLSKK